MSQLPRRHILLLPPPFYGLYIPMLEFAKKAIEHHDITFMVMQSKLDDISEHDLLPPSSIRWVPFRDNMEIERGGDISISSNTELMTKTGDVYRILIDCIPTRTSPPISSEYDVDLDPVDVVMFDRFIFSVPGACNARKIPHYAFSFLPPVTTLNMLVVTETSPVTPDLFLDDSEAGKAAKRMFIECNEQMQTGGGLVLNSYIEADPDIKPTLEKAKRKFKPPVHFIGPIIGPVEDPDSDVSRWLSRQPLKSVIYFSFGSVLSGQPEQLAEIGKALLKLKRPFVWSLHKSAQIPVELSRSSLDHIDMDVPYLILPWLKQKEVLSHPSTAVFVSHCGYNSIVEAAHYAVPMVGWPLFGDEFTNADYVEKRGYGKRIRDTKLQNGRTVPAEEIVGTIKEVTGWENEKGDTMYREKALALQAEIGWAGSPDGPSTKQFLALMEEIRDIRGG